MSGTKKVSAERNAGSRTERISRIAEKKAIHDTKIRQEIRGRTLKLSRKDRKRPDKDADIVAYDLETTRIKEGTPEPLYITAFADHRNYVLSTPCDGLKGLAAIVIKHFLTLEFKDAKFVAWNGNNYDVYFVALALLDHPEYVLRPYLTKGKNLRGLRVVAREDLHLKPRQQRSWEFIDGISMLGLQGRTLKDFLKTFAPEYQKLDRESFDTKEFDATNPDEIAYAFRDSEGLYFGMQKAQEIISTHFRMSLKTTIGNLGVKIFASQIPEETVIVESNVTALSILRQYVCRGGYCHLMRKYKGPVWKYDLNQAYAAAMREAQLPAGRCTRIKGESKYADVFMCRINARNPNNKIPFYCRMDVDGKVKSVFATTRIDNSWITSSELRQLRAENWEIEVFESYTWYDKFNMREFVDKLEYLRQNCEGGPKGATGTMIKQIGNNSYGKTLEELSPLELVMARECPPGYSDYYGEEDPGLIPYVWCRFVDTPAKNYHQPQIGAFITAHVRMVVRRAALLAPENFLYADTDCVVFNRDLTAKLDCNETRYGAWKVENSGDEYLLIAKKVYASVDFSTRHSKGLNVKNLNFDDFVRWYEGKVPTQHQAQRQNFVKVVKGAPMFVNRTRRGTAV